MAKANDSKDSDRDDDSDRAETSQGGGGGSSQNSSDGQSADPDTLTGILEAVRQKADEDDGKSTVGAILGVFGTRAHGPLLLVPGLISVSPVGMIPGMSIVCGSLIFLVAMQMPFGGGKLWVPHRIANFEVPSDKLEWSIERGEPWARWIDRYVGSRLSFLVRGPANIAIALICALLGLSMWPLALVPFAVSAPGTAVSLYGLALALGDGLLGLLAYTATVGVAVLLWFVLL